MAVGGHFFECKTFRPTKLYQKFLQKNMEISRLLHSSKKLTTVTKLGSQPAAERTDTSNTTFALQSG